MRFFKLKLTKHGINFLQTIKENKHSEDTEIGPTKGQRLVFFHCQ